MSIKSADFLDYACAELGSSDLSEFEIRNASSRAYYAVFHAARERLDVLGRSSKSSEEGSHKAVIDVVRSISPGSRSLATDMDRLKRFRNNCDYDLSLSISEASAKKHLAESLRIIDRLTRLS